LTDRAQSCLLHHGEYDAAPSSWVRQLRDVAEVLADVDPKLKSQLYEELGISVY